MAPILWHLGNLVVCFKRAEHVSDDDVSGQADDKWWTAIAPALPFGDRKSNNIGIIDGHLVWLDYDSSWNGCPHNPYNTP